MKVDQTRLVTTGIQWQSLPNLHGVLLTEARVPEVVLLTEMGGIFKRTLIPSVLHEIRKHALPLLLMVRNIGSSDSENLTEVGKGGPDVPKG